MGLDNSVKNLIGNLFRIDSNLAFFAPGYLSSKKVTEENLPWLGLKNLNRIVYFATTFNYFFFETMIADITIALDSKQKEPIIIEVKDNFKNLIELEKLGFLQSKIENIPAAQMMLLKDLYKFMSTKYDKFNSLFENDPNIKILANHSGNLSSPVFLENSEVYNYYEKAAKQIFGK
ncbi:hypothetical protein [Spiroplasma diminutum]|uniref:Uncharacterized protein n=1 Tax=Spiroplasma diminutum CUAS-1 TaxID=1276221 RepID=S5M1X9_9MOLU|nr:hypothetical protein [Spiroplasma diminutum]AGR42077.1 hypothetical protein SDIMI_v3c03730 [Spiroplasma diminutum CUAS-1]